MNLFLWLCSVILGVSFCFLLYLSVIFLRFSLLTSLLPVFPRFLSTSVPLSLFCRPHWFFRELMWAQIFSAGPSLMFMLVIRWSSVSSSRAWPSISCSRNASATSLQPGTRAHGDTETRLKKRNVTACLNSYCKTTYCPFKDELWAETTALVVGQRASNKQHEQI